MATDPTMELFSSVSPSAPPGDGDDVYDAREREIEGGGGGGDDAPGTLHLAVTDPQQIGEGRNIHTYYRIDVYQSGNSNPIASVRRRYSDFQWLFQRLHAERPGAMVPIIPHTQAVQMSKRLSEELIEERRGHLERFLRKVQVHPELEGVPSLSAFFSPDAEAFEAAKKAYPTSGLDVASLLAEEDINTTTAAKVSEKLKHFFVKATVKVKAARGGELEETDDGAQMEVVANYLNELNAQMKTIIKATNYLVNVPRESSTNMHELGQSLFGLHQLHHPESASNPYVVDSELMQSNSNSDTKTSNYPSMKLISNIFSSLSAVHKVKYDEHQLKVGSLLQEIEWSIKSARLALKRRKNAQLTYNTYLQQLKNREQALDKLTKAADMSAQPANSDGKVAEMQKSIDATRESARNARIELNAVTQRVFREMDRFKMCVDVELRKLYVIHARVELDYSEQLDCEWKKMLNLPRTIGGGGEAKDGGGGGGENDMEGSLPSMNSGNDAEEMQMI